MKTIPLTKGQVALVDDEDHEFLSQWKWHARKCRDLWYAVRSERLSTGKQRTIYMHRVLCSGLEIDHDDRNGCNNQKRNLRDASHSLNMFNSSHRVGKSGVRGVLRRKSGRWQARISLNRKRYILGSFVTLEEAKEARRIAELKFFGEVYKPLNS